MALLLPAGAARAQALFVANNGLDSNPCSKTSPCATFQGAINKVNVSTINCLTSGDYGPATITASLTIDCGTGNIGNVVVSGQGSSAININTNAAATIVLRHLNLNGLGTATFGIVVNGLPSGTLIVEDCVIQQFGDQSAGDGIVFGTNTGRGLLQVSNSLIFRNNNGIVVMPLSGQIDTVTLSKVELTANALEGLILTSSGGGIVAGTMRDSLVGGNGGAGVFANSSQVYFTVEGSSVVANLINGIQTNSAGAVLNVGSSTIGGNGTGVAATSGAIISFGNNQMSANGSNGNFTSTTALR
jgi:hypothetical protein